RGGGPTCPATGGKRVGHEQACGVEMAPVNSARLRPSMAALRTHSAAVQQGYELSDQSSAFQVTPTLEVLGRTPFRLFDQTKNWGVWYRGRVTMFCHRM